jgi:hypothetical protein
MYVQPQDALQVHAMVPRPLHTMQVAQLDIAVPGVVKPGAKAIAAQVPTIVWLVSSYHDGSQSFGHSAGAAIGTAGELKGTGMSASESKASVWKRMMPTFLWFEVEGREIPVGGTDASRPHPIE